jgi:hypothetical protein
VGKTYARAHQWRALLERNIFRKVYSGFWVGQHELCESTIMFETGHFPFLAKAWILAA